MTKRKIEIEVDVPEGYEVIGEFRSPNTGEPFISDEGKVIKLPRGLSLGPRIILREIGPQIPEVQGPRGWPKLRWACKSANTGEWALFTDKPVMAFFEDHVVINIKGAAVLARKIGWTPPPEIADLPSQKSLTRLRHDVDSHE